MVRRLRAAEIVLVLAAVATPAWSDGGDEVTEEVTIEPKTHVLFGMGYGGPVGGAATFELIHGLGADVREDKDRVKAIVGGLFQLQAGTAGGKFSLGVGAHAHVRDEDFNGTVGAAVKLSLAHTWDSEFSPEGQTLLGPEIELSAMHVALELGVLFRVGGPSGDDVHFSWGLGIRLP
jgi:hypothetical protein